MDDLGYLTQPHNPIPGFRAPSKMIADGLSEEAKREIVEMVKREVIDDLLQALKQDDARS